MNDKCILFPISLLAVCSPSAQVLQPGSKQGVGPDVCDLENKFENISTFIV